MARLFLYLAEAAACGILGAISFSRLSSAPNKELKNTNLFIQKRPPEEPAPFMVGACEHLQPDQVKLKVKVNIDGVGHRR